MWTASLQSMTVSLALHAALLGLAARSETQRVSRRSSALSAPAEMVIALEAAPTLDAFQGAERLDGAARPASDALPPGPAAPARIESLGVPPAREHRAANAGARARARRGPVARKPPPPENALPQAGAPPSAPARPSPPAALAAAPSAARSDAPAHAAPAPFDVSARPTGSPSATAPMAGPRESTGRPTAVASSSRAGRSGSGSPLAGVGLHGGREGGSSSDRARLLAAYLEQVHARVAQHREYPYVARRAQLEGTVCLRLSLAASGSVLGVTPTCGASQRPLLDAALRSISNAAPFPPLPTALGRRLTLDVPVVFALDPP